MADVDVTNFAGTTVNGASPYRVLRIAGDAPESHISVEATARRNSAGVFEAISYEPLELTLHVFAGASASSYATFKRAVESLFQPWTSNVARQLVGTLDGTSTGVYLDVVVTSLRKIRDAGSLSTVEYLVALRADFPRWRTTSDSTSTGSPTNAGNSPAPATIELTTSTHKQIRSCSVAGAGANGGLMGYPVKLAYTQAGMVAGEVIAMVNGSNTPTYSDDYTAYVWTIVDTSQDGTQATAIDLLTVDGIGISNPLGGRLEQGGMKLGDAVTGTDCSNTTWAWNDFSISQNPIRCGAWRPAVVGSVANLVCWISSESSSGVSFKIDNDPIDSGTRANAMAMVIGSQGNSLAGLTRVMSGVSDGYSRQFVAVRAFGSANWSYVQSATANGTVSSAVSLANGVEVAVGIDGLQLSMNTQTLDLSAPGSGGVFTLSLNATPTITVGASANADYYNGTLTNSTTGDSIEFRDVLVRDGTLSIDSLRRRWSTSVGALEPIYGDPRFTNDDNWFLLAPGANSISNGVTGASYTARWREAYA